MKVSRKVVVRDFAIFQVKLVLDGFKDGLLMGLSIGALVLDLFRGGRRKRLFYRVMDLGERIDLWLNLHGAAARAEETEDGLFGASKAGSPSMLGRLEQTVRGGDEPRRSRRGREARRPTRGGPSPLDDPEL